MRGLRTHLDVERRQRARIAACGFAVLAPVFSAHAWAAPSDRHLDALRALHDALESQATIPSVPPRLPARTTDSPKGPTRPLPGTASQAATEARAAAVLRRVEAAAQRQAERVAGQSTTPAMRGARADSEGKDNGENGLHGSTAGTPSASPTQARRASETRRDEKGPKEPKKKD